MPPQKPAIGRRGGRSDRQVIVPAEPSGMQHGERRPPRMADRGVAPRQRKRLHVGGAGELASSDHEKLTPLDRAVAAVARAVEADADESCGSRGDGMPMLGEQCRYVRLVVLHPHERDAAARGEPRRPVGREVARVQVGHHRLRDDIEQAQKVGCSTVEGIECLESGHVADVLAHHGHVVPGHADRRLEFAADRQHGGASAGEPDRQGRVAARAADRRHPAGDAADHRVVARHVDRPVVEEECIHERREPHGCVGIGVGDRLLSEVAGGHHQWRQSRAEQLVQRRRRQHHPHNVDAGGDPVGELRPSFGAVRLSAEEHHGPLAAFE